MDDVTRMRRPGGGAMRAMQEGEPPQKADKEPSRGIDFSVVLTRPDGTPQTETPVPTIAQIAQLADSNSFADMVSKLREISAQKPMTLAKACDIALDVGIDADKNEGLKPKLKRGALMDKIAKSVEEGRELTLKSEDVTLIKNRIGALFSQAYLVRSICILLDPATATEE